MYVCSFDLLVYIAHIICIVSTLSSHCCQVCAAILAGRVLSWIRFEFQKTLWTRLSTLVCQVFYFPILGTPSWVTSAEIQPKKMFIGQHSACSFSLRASSLCESLACSLNHTFVQIHNICHQISDLRFWLWQTW